MNKLLYFGTVSLMLASCETAKNKPGVKNTSIGIAAETKSVQVESVYARPLSCKLTAIDLEKRKRSDLVILRKNFMERKELALGFGYKFGSSNETIDLLSDFIKSERECCDFFNFSLEIKSDAIWLSITGPKGAKNLIKNKLEL